MGGWGKGWEFWKVRAAEKPNLAPPPVRPPERRPPPPAPAAPPQPKTQDVDDGDTFNTWQGFVAFVGKEKRPLSPYLESATALELPPGPLRFGIAERYHLAFWQDGDNLTTLKDLAKRYFQQDVDLHIVNPIRQGDAKPTEAIAVAPVSPGEDRSPMVKEALRIFGGSVR